MSKEKVKKWYRIPYSSFSRVGIGSGFFPKVESGSGYYPFGYVTLLA